MSENQIRQRIVDTAMYFIGVKEDCTVYITHPWGHALTIAEQWCTGFVSAIAIICGAMDIIPVECSCSTMIELFKALGYWQEKDKYVPKPGDIVFSTGRIKIIATTPPLLTTWALWHPARMA